jgi:hypothetical protein
MLHNMHIVSVCFKCFIRMLQVFHLDVAEIDLDVAYIAMTIHTCFNRMFQVFHLFQSYATTISIGCFKSRSRGAHVAMVKGIDG